MREAEIVKLAAHRDCSTGLAGRGYVLEDDKMTGRIWAVPSGRPFKGRPFECWRVDRLSNNRIIRRVQSVSSPSDEIFCAPDSEAFGGFVLSTAYAAGSIAGKTGGGLRPFVLLSS